jgi:hypothetical protein
VAGFLFYEDYYKIGKNLPTDKDKVMFYEAIFERGLSGKPLEKTGNPVTDTAFIFIESLIMANEKRRENGKKGGRPKGSKNKKPVVSLNDNVNDNVNANANDNVNNLSSSDMVPLEGDQSSDAVSEVEFDEEGWQDP